MAGITISPSYVGEPECNGVIERFMRTLKEQCLYLHRFQTLEEARGVIAKFIDRSPAFAYEPETNGVVEKFIQTLKEQVLWIERFDTLEQLRARVRAFAEQFNEHWLLERHGYRTPRQARDALPQSALT